MAVIKQRLLRKNTSGSYDTLHLETSAVNVLMANGTTAEATINGKAASNHTHSGYASTSHSHSFANINGNLTTTQITYIKSQLSSGTSWNWFKAAPAIDTSKYLILIVARGYDVWTAVGGNALWVIKADTYGSSPTAWQSTSFTIKPGSIKFTPSGGDITYSILGWYLKNK